MRRQKGDILFLLASLAGAGGIVASLRGTEAMLYLAFSLLGIGGVLIATGMVVDKVRGSPPGNASAASREKRESVSSQEDTAHIRQRRG